MNAKISILYTEDDYTYFFAKVLSQILSDVKSWDYRRMFSFKLMKDNVLLFHLKSIYLLFLQASFFLIGNNVYLCETQLVLNFTILFCMVTKRLFSHIKKYLGRSLDDLKFSEWKCENTHINIAWLSCIKIIHYL